MPNSFYNTTSFPATGSAATSASMRAELARIAAGFDKLPALASNANKIVVVNLGATGLDVLAAPAGDLVGTSATQTLTGKSISMASNTLTGTLAQFNTALTDADFATLAGVETLTNKTISGGAINGTPIGAGAASTGAFSSISVSGAASLGGNTTLSAGSANGVAYLNGSKVLTTGSALTFDGSGTMFLGVAGSANTTTLIYLNATDNAANGGAIVGRRGGANAWVLGDRSTIDGSGAGFVSYNYGGTAPWIWQYQNVGEQMRLTSTGLGIGTSSVQSALTIEKNTLANTVATTASIVLSNRNGTPGTFMSGGIFSNTYRDITDTNYTAGIWFEKQNSGVYGTSSSRGAIVFGTQDTNEFGQIPTERMRLDAAGNLGLGVTPSAWSSGRKAFQFGGAGNSSFIASSPGTANFLEMGANFYTNDTPQTIYYATGAATCYSQSSGSHQWFTAPSGTAGSPITFTQGMTLTSSNNLLLGTTSELGRLTLQGTVATIATVTNISQLSGGIRYIGNAQPNQTESGLTFQAGGAGGGAAITLRRGGSYETALDFYTNGTTPFAGACKLGMTLDNNGNLLVGTTDVLGAQGFVYSAPNQQIALGHTNGTPSGVNYLNCLYNSNTIGSITQNGTTGVLYNTTSDQRLKENIQDSGSASSLIDAIQVRQYDWKTDGSHQRYGFVAQEIVEVAPEAVHQPEDPEAMMAVDYSKLVPMLVKEIQDLRKRLAAAGI